MRSFVALSAALVLAAPAAAAGSPRFALWDLQRDLAHASRNAYGDVAVKPRASVAGTGTLVRCGTWCRFGPGWLAFRGRPRLGAADVTAARVVYSTRRGWTVRVALKPAAAGRWAAFARSLARSTRRRGVPDVLVVAAAGQVAATPLATGVASSGRALVLTGFDRSAAHALAAALR